MAKYTLKILWCSHDRTLSKVCLAIFQYKHERNLNTMHPAKISFKLLKDTTLISLKGIC